MKLQQVLEKTTYRIVQGDVDPLCKGVTHDSREVKEDWLFVARSGLQQHGVSFVSDALQRGATIIAGEADVVQSLSCNPSVTLVEVEDVRPLLAQASAALCHHPSQQLSLVGVTGTNGKTSVSWMLHEVLNRQGRKAGLIGTIHYDTGRNTYPAPLTTPEAPRLHALMEEMVQHGCDSVAMEVSSHALDRGRMIGLEFDVAVFTNFTQDHLDYHENMDAYFAAKAKLFEQLNPLSGIAIFPFESEYLDKLRERCPAGVKVLTFGTEPGADLYASSIRVELGQTRFHARTPWGELDVELSQTGRFHVENTLACIGVLGGLGLPVETLAHHFSQVQPVPGRMEKVSGDEAVTILIDYAHTEDALKQALIAVRETRPRKSILVFGCGGDRDRAKRQAMGWVASEHADLVVVTSDNPRSESPQQIIDDILKGMVPNQERHVEPNRSQAIALALGLAEAGDVVLIAGKGHETYEESKGKRVPYSDHAVVAQWLKKGCVHHG